MAGLNKLCLRRQYRQILLGSVGEEADNSSNELIGSVLERQNANCGVGLSTGGFPVAYISAASDMNIQVSGSPLRNAPPNDEKQAGGDNDRRGNVAGARINLSLIHI